MRRQVVARDAEHERAAEGESSLRNRQLRFAAAVMTPESEASSLDDKAAARWLTAGPRMTALERLEVYRRAYHARLVECLSDDYAATACALGDSAFEELCRHYIVRFPSSGPSLNYFGRSMSDFVRSAMPGPFPLRSFVADLTTLEWAVVEVIHAPAEPPLTLDALREVAPAGWAELRLYATSAMRLLRFEYPVNAYFQAFLEGAAPAVPAASASATVVYRSGPTVWRMDLTRTMVEVLSALLAGETVGAALARAESGLPHLDESELGSHVQAWFREWFAHGLFVRAS
jgi:hypothetical protein